MGSKSIFYREKGFTLIEILIVLLLVAIISAVVFPVLYVSNQSYQFDITTVEDVQQARRVIKRITDEINYVSPNNIFTINPDLVNARSSILLYTNNTGNSCRIFLNRGSIFLRVAAQPDIPITNQNTIQALLFAFDPVDAANRTISITITLRNGRSFTSNARQLN